MGISVGSLFGRGKNRRCLEEYHQWYYDTAVWQGVKYRGLTCWKSVSDLWNYQEIISEMKPSLVVEFGTAHGGSAMFFSDILKAVNPVSKVLSVDIQDMAGSLVRKNDHIELMNCSSTDGRVAARIKEVRDTFPGPVFAILDSDHKKGHVIAEMESLRDVLVTGDFLVVEDTNINGHPVLPGFGEGPMEAVIEYFARYPRDYAHDLGREAKFGFTFAPQGYLRRQ